jgi:hypothetical protein
VFKIKNVKLVNVLWQMTEQNSTQVVQKMLWAVMSDITVKNILTSELMTHKLMFKLSKSDIIFKISETEKVNINSLQTFCYSMFSTHSSVQEQLWRLKKVKYQHWLTWCRSEPCQRMHSSETQCFYTVDGCLQLIDINDQKTVLHDICENVEIQIDW